MNKESFGTLASGQQIDLFTLRNAHGIEAQICNFGGRVVRLKVPDRNGKVDDVVLGFDDLEGYVGHNPYFGAIIGRYANRIAKARFTLHGQTYELAKNNGENSLHGGKLGFDSVAWTASEGPGESLGLSYLSRDGEDGYPGNLQVKCTYTLTDDNELKFETEANTDKPTVLNITNHSYFDLAGYAADKVLDHIVTINADRFLPTDAHGIPSGELRVVEGTPFDFRKPHRIGDHIDSSYEQIQLGIGYDHTFVLNQRGNELSLAAHVLDPSSGRVLEVHTTEPGVQFYTGNHLRGDVIGKGGKVCKFRSAFCFETQHFPDSPNQPQFPSTELKPGETFRSTTVFKFSAS